MDAKDILKKIKAVFNETQVIPPVIPAPVAPAKLATNFPVDGGAAVYVDSDTIATGASVWADEAMTMPYPDGSYTVTGTTFTFTVAAGVVTAADGSLTDTAAAVVPPAAPAPVLPMAPTIPQFEAMQKEVNDLKAALSKANLLAEKHEKILPDLFELAEKLTEIPVGDPKALNDRQKEKFDYAKKRDERIDTIAQSLKTLKSK